MEIQTAVPFLIFLLGVLFSPLAEHLSFVRKKNRMLKRFKIELKDEILYLNSSLKKALSTLRTVETLKNKKEVKKGQSSKFVARKLYLIFLESVIDYGYSISSMEQRNQLKIFDGQVKALNNYMEEISLLETKLENYDLLIKLYKKYLFTGLCTRYCMKAFLSNKAVPGDKLIIGNQIEEMSLDLTFNDIVNTRLYSYTVHE